MMRTTLLFKCLALFAFLLLAACGGGGAGESDGGDGGAGGGGGGTTYDLQVTVSGLTGTGLVLQNDGGDDLGIDNDGQHTFATALPNNAAYNVQVSVHPTGPQTCTVSNGSGTVSGADITNVTVQCANAVPHTLYANVSGLVGSGLVLQNDGANNLSISSNGTGQFPNPIYADRNYSVTVASQPSMPNQTCVVADATGVVSGNVTVDVTCTTNPTYSVGGTITGLANDGLVLQNDGGDNLNIDRDDTGFTMPTELYNDTAYDITVGTQPSGQVCSVTNGNGRIDNADVTDIAVNCQTALSYDVSVTVTGLSGSGLVLQNNGGDNLMVGGNTLHTFTTQILDGRMYNVTVATQPTSPDQTCTVTSGSGVIAGSDVSDIIVTCEAVVEYTLSVNVQGLNGAGLVLQNNGGNDLAVVADGVFNFSEPVYEARAYDVTVASQPVAPPSDQRCTVASGSGGHGRGYHRRRYLRGHRHVHHWRYRQRPYGNRIGVTKQRW